MIYVTNLDTNTTYGFVAKTAYEAMTKLKYTAKQAMDFLEIPPADQPKYLKKL